MSLIVLRPAVSPLRFEVAWGMADPALLVWVQTPTPLDTAAWQLEVIAPRNVFIFFVETNM